MSYTVNYIEGSETIPRPMSLNLKITGEGLRIRGYASNKDMLPWEAIQRVDLEPFTIKGVWGSRRIGANLKIRYLTPDYIKNTLVLELSYIHVADRIKNKIDKQLIERFGKAKRLEFYSYPPKPDASWIEKHKLFSISVTSFVVFSLLIGLANRAQDITNGTSSNQSFSNTQKEAAPTAEIKATVTAPRFDTYFNKPMADVATELKPYLYEYNFSTKSYEPAPRDYDPNYSHQIYAKKDGYGLSFENGASSANSKYGTPEGNYNGTANIMSIELAQMGKCNFSQVFNKIDDAMKLVGLDPATKGIRNDDGGGTQQGYGSFRNYLGKDSLEIALICDYEGANYKLQLRVLPWYR